jgi:hypothetical protein
MQIAKTFAFLPLTAAVLFAVLGCTAEQRVETPEQEQIEKSLVPAKAEVTGRDFSLKVTDLKVAMTVDPDSKEIVETPKLRGSIHIINTSQNILDIQAVSLGYMAAAGKLIPFNSGEKMSKLDSSWKLIKPGEAFEGSIDAAIPLAAVKEKALGQIEVEEVYVPSPVKRENLSLIERIE